MRRHRAGRQVQAHAPGHRRVADAIGLAALEGGHQRHAGRIGAVAQQRQGDFGLVEIHHHIAEVLVAVGAALRPPRQAGADVAGAFQRQRGAVAVEVVAGGRGETQQQAVAVADDRLEVEGLVGRERQGVHASGLAGRAEQPCATGAARHQRAQAFARRSGGWRVGQVHAQFAALRRVAHAGIGAALVLHLQDRAALTGRGLAGQAGLQRGAVGLHLAEEFVVLALAFRQIQRTGGEALAGFDADAMPVQVVTRGDLPGQRDAVTSIGLGAQCEGLVHWQQVCLGNRLRRWRGQQQRQGDEQGRDQYGAAGDPAGQGLHERQDSLRVSARTQSR